MPRLARKFSGYEHRWIRWGESKQYIIRYLGSPQRFPQFECVSYHSIRNVWEYHKLLEIRLIDQSEEFKPDSSDMRSLFGAIFEGKFKSR